MLRILDNYMPGFLITLGVIVLVVCGFTYLMYADKLQADVLMTLPDADRAQVMLYLSCVDSQGQDDDQLRCFDKFPQGAMKHREIE